MQHAVRASGLTQQQLADRIGVDPTALSRSLGGKRQFKPVELALIAEQLGVPIQRLLGEDRDSDQGGVAIAARAQAGTSPAVDGALDRVQLMLDLDQLLAELGFPGFAASRPTRMPSAAPHEQGERLATDLRARLASAPPTCPPRSARWRPTSRMSWISMSPSSRCHLALTDWPRAGPASS